MIELIGFIALVLWVGKRFSPVIAGFMIIGAIVLFLIVGNKMDQESWKAHVNRTEYWKNRRN